MTLQGYKTTMAANSLNTALNDSTASNTTNKTQDSLCLPEVLARPFFFVSYSTVCFVCLALNTITMRVYYCTSLKFQSSVTVYLKNLAAADFFLCLVLPLRIANYANKSTALQHIYCNFGAAGFYLNMYASILFMDYIAANRYLKIAYPLKTHVLQTARAARCISIITWTFLSTMALIYIVVFLSTSSGASPKPNVIGCESLHSHQVSTVYKVIHCVSALIFTFVLVSLILFYWSTVRRLHYATMQTQRNHHKLSRSKRNMLVLVVVFCVCFVPYHLVRLPYAFLKPLLQGCGTSAKSFYIIKEVTVLLSVLNACMDPLIYFVFCKGFRDQLGIRNLQVCKNLMLCEFQRDTRKQRSTETGESRVTVRCESVNPLHSTQQCQLELQTLRS
ncbi:P2Y purinoceptor 14-like [Tachysurus vachellii]|uniref:P2Y purinoceptor 14-like n=1 Tax=Tachysurus vachellii TaxID=175792 RepID=UPI00296B0E86|nr:P2Y purinoceptor 14-like [Tachysurus vachellii]